MSKTTIVHLTKREAEVLRGLCNWSKTPSVIADELYISKRTVDFHTCNLFAKFDCNTRGELTVQAQVREVRVGR